MALLGTEYGALTATNISDRAYVMPDPFRPHRKIALRGITELDLRTVAAQLSMLLDRVPEELLSEVMFFAGFSAPSVERIGSLMDRAQLRRRIEPAVLVGQLKCKVDNYITHRLDDADFLDELRHQTHIFRR